MAGPRRIPSSAQRHVNSPTAGSASSSQLNIIEFSYLRPDAIPTSDLPRQNISYDSIRERLGLTVTEMATLRAFLDSIVLKNPDFHGLNLRVASERQHLCDVANREVDDFPSDITRKLQERDEETGTIGWLLYQFLFWCLKEQRLDGGTRLRNGSSSAELETAGGGEGSTIFVHTPLQIQHGLARGSSIPGRGTTNGDEHHSEPDYAGMELTEPPSQMVDTSDLERELAHYEERVEPYVNRRHGSRSYLRSRRGNRALPRLMVAPMDDGTDGEDENIPADPPGFFQSPRFHMILLLTSLFIVSALVIALCSVQYFHEKNRTARLWDTILMHQRVSVTVSPNIHLTTRTRIETNQ
ncbi:hypothetical protein ABW19_dt0207833 [Dactylella cylindrospora]|nr:hypothetical protein ABW19_dt0207833 [Dactylella cylindrospora]